MLGSRRGSLAALAALGVIGTAQGAPTVYAFPSVFNGGRLTAHLKRTRDGGVALFGRAPADSSISVTFLGAHGQLLGKVGGGTFSGRDRYRFTTGAFHKRARAIVTTPVRHGVLRARTRLVRL